MQREYLVQCIKWSRNSISWSLIQLSFHLTCPLRVFEWWMWKRLIKSGFSLLTFRLMFSVIQSENRRSLCILGRICSGDPGRILFFWQGWEETFLFLKFFPIVIEHNWQVTLCVSLRCTMCWFDTFISCKIITTFVLATASISWSSHHLFFVVRPFMIFSVSNSPVYYLYSIISYNHQLYLISLNLFILKLRLCTFRPICPHLSHPNSW